MNRDNFVAISHGLIWATSFWTFSKTKHVLIKTVNENEQRKAKIRPAMKTVALFVMFVWFYDVMKLFMGHNQFFCYNGLFWARAWSTSWQSLWAISSPLKLWLELRNVRQTNATRSRRVASLSSDRIQYLYLSFSFVQFTREIENSHDRHRQSKRCTLLVNILVYFKYVTL